MSISSIRWHGSLTRSLWSPTQDDRVRYRHGTDSTAILDWSGREREGLASHRTGQVGAECLCRTRPCSIAATCPCPPERWRRDSDTDSGLALVDATSLAENWHGPSAQWDRALSRSGTSRLCRCVGCSNHIQSANDSNAPWIKNG
jgi:hypothetical protein